MASNKRPANFNDAESDMKVKKHQLVMECPKTDSINARSNEQTFVKNTESKNNADLKNQIDDINGCTNSIKLRKDIFLSNLGHNLCFLSLEKQGRARNRLNTQLGIPIHKFGDPRQWSFEEVASYVDQIVTSNNSNHTTNEEITIPQRFVNKEIDGLAFLMLTQDELMKLLKIPLGPAIKIFNAILMLRQKAIRFNLHD